VLLADRRRRETRELLDFCSAGNPPDVEAIRSDEISSALQAHVPLVGSDQSIPQMSAMVSR
jgi:hypothetical protein